MAEQTGISWSHATLNFWVGCTKVSNGDHGACEHCYAESWAKRWPAYRDTWGVGATRVRFKDTRAKALKLERLAVASGAPFYCFSNSLSDIFDNAVPIEWLADAFEDMRAAPHVTFLLLTKRPQNIAKRFSQTITPELRTELSRTVMLGCSLWPRNVAIGCTVVNQEEADRDVPHLLGAKAGLKPALAFLSMEPLMGPVDLTNLSTLQFLRAEVLNALTGELSGMFEDPAGYTSAIDWVITGGESGAKARPTHPDWLRSIRDQCAMAGVPYHHKQNGEWAADPDLDRPFVAHGSRAELGTVERLQSSSGDYAVAWQRRSEPLGSITEGIQLKRVGKKHAGRLLDGVLHDAMPEVSG